MMRSISHAATVCVLSLSLAACDREPTPAPEDGGAHAAAPEEGVTLDAAGREHLGLKLAKLAAASTRDELELNGRIVEDPAQGFVLRAPVSGTLGASAAWPGLGSVLASGAVPGSITPRLSVTERLDLAARSAQARTDASVAAEELGAAERELERAAQLNALDKAVSDKSLEEARARVSVARVRRDAARGEEERLKAAPADGDGALAAVPLRVALDGEVLEVLAAPGEALEAGAPILRLVRRSAPLAELELPLGARASARTLRVQPIAQPGRWLEAEVLARRAGPGGNAVLVVRLGGDAADLRPGDAIVARLASSDRVLDGVLLPSSAVVRTAGRAWCWVAHGATQLVREPVDLAHPVAGGWVITDAWARGAEVVVEGAQALLSVELLASEKGASTGD